MVKSAMVKEVPGEEKERKTEAEVVDRIRNQTSER